MSRVWNWQRWGRADDLIHQSDLTGLLGKFGCPQQFKRKKEERATGAANKDDTRISAKLAAGIAVHAVIHRVLRNTAARDVVLSCEGAGKLSDASIRDAYKEEFGRAHENREIVWRKSTPEKLHDECFSMLRGLLDDLRNHVAEVVLAECAFAYPLDGMWLTGTIDLVYRARNKDGSASDRLSFADWKTGALRPHQIDLDHGWQSAIYANAMRDGYFIPFEKVPRIEGEAHRDSVERACVQIATAWQVWKDEGSLDRKDESTESTRRLNKVLAERGAIRFDEYPNQIFYVHLRDYIPYLRATKKMLSRPEELEWCGLHEPERVSFEKGDPRGPAWYRVQRSESDTPRLRHMLRAVVSWVRFGRFPSAPGELCVRCPFREPCLLDGYKPIGDQKRALERAIRPLQFDGLDFDEL